MINTTCEVCGGETTEKRAGWPPLCSERCRYVFGVDATAESSEQRREDIESYWADKL